MQPESHANTFEELAQIIQEYSKAMFQKGESQPHLQAMSKMRVLVPSHDGMAKQMERKWKVLVAKPDSE
ncbi:hypothetical protein BDK62_10781 [Halomonas alkaliantarctica]|nr:hypothetical protein BDK62_10781 [Halomonas alkaliantarctica]